MFDYGTQYEKNFDKGPNISLIIYIFESWNYLYLIAKESKDSKTWAPPWEEKKEETKKRYRENETYMKYKQKLPPSDFEWFIDR